MVLTLNVSECALRTWLVNDHPVCGAKVGFADFLVMPQPPLLPRTTNLNSSTLIEALFASISGARMRNRCMFF